MMHRRQIEKLDGVIPSGMLADLKQRYALTEDQLARIKASAMASENLESKLIFQLAWHRHRPIEIINARYGISGDGKPDLILVPLSKGRYHLSYIPVVYKIEKSALVRLDYDEDHKVGKALISHPCNSRYFHPQVKLQKIVKGWFRDTDVASDKQTLSALRYCLL